MKRLAIMLGGAAIATGLLYHTVGSAQFEPPAVEPRSYGAGFGLGEQIRNELARDGVGADLDLVTKGFRDATTGQTPFAPRGELEAILTAVQREMEDRMVRRLLEENPEFRKLHDDNLARSRAFHDLFGRQPGVVTDPGGVQYKVLRSGNGPSPAASDTVVVKAYVTLLDGTVIDAGESEEVRVDAVVEGGARLLQMMNAGAKWQVAVPPELAHGAAGRLPDIGPQETLVGIVELVAVKPRAAG